MASEQHAESNVPDAAPTVTVVIPSHGDDDTIARAVDSALGQNGGKVAVIIVIDDGCERTRGALDARHDERIAVIMNERHIGAPASRNRGLERVATPFVSFLDADDRFDGDFLAPLMGEMVKCQADLGFGPSITWNPERGLGPVRMPRFRDHADVFSQWLGKRRNVNTASVLWSTHYVRAIGGWDPAVLRNQDGEIALRAILKGARFVTSNRGAGVWTNDRRRGRITMRTDNFGSLIYIVDKFLEMPCDAVPEAILLAVCARYCLTIAHLAFSNGQDDVGRQALRRRRSLGVADYQADWRYVASASSRFIPRAPRMLLWRLFRRLRALRP